MKPRIACLYIDENREKKVIGGLVLWDAASIQENIFRIQQEKKFYEEMKYEKMSNLRRNMYQGILSHVNTISHRDFYYGNIEGTNILHMYTKFIAKLLKNINNIDYVLIFIDYITYSKLSGILLETYIMDSSEKILFCLREDSKSNKLIQLSDLFLGIATNIDSEYIIGSHKQVFQEFADNLGIKKKFKQI